MGANLFANYPGSWTIFLVCFVFCNLLTGTLYGLARKYSLMTPEVRERDVHTKPKPRVGGVSMWLTVLLAGLVIVIGDRMKLLDFQTPATTGLPSPLWGVLFGLVVLLIFGLWDDLKGLSPRRQLLGQLLTAVAAVLGGLQVQYVRLPYNHELRLDTLALHLPHWLGGTIWIWSALFTIIWIVTMINVMNFFDGLDGLAGSVAMTASVVLLIVSLRLGFIGAATLSLILFGTVAGFLPWNWYPAKLFMGTVGSQLLGFLLGVIAVISGAKLASAVLVLGIPVLDAFIVILRRLLARTSPFQADQRHLHHRLLKLGIRTPYVVLIINAVAIVFGGLALRTQQSTGKGMLLLVLFACMLLFILITYALERRVERRVD